MSSASVAPIDQFIEEYVDANAWKDSRDPDTCRSNAQKYAVSLRGTDDRLGWFDWLSDRGNESPDEATPEDVKRFLRYLQKQGLSASTRNQARSGISQYYQLMEPDHPNPVDGLDASWTVSTDKEKSTGEERVYLTRDGVATLIDNAPEPTLQSELIISLLYQTGVRRMELARMKVNKTDTEAREIRVYGDKTNEWRTVIYQPSLDTTLRLWLSSARKGVVGYTPDNPYLFPTMSLQGEKDHISGQKIYETVVQAAKNAGIQESYGRDATGKNQNKIVPHTLRHTFAVHSAENGVPAPHLQAVLGHHSLDITQIYVNIAGKDAAEMLKAKGPSL